MKQISITKEFSKSKETERQFWINETSKMLSKPFVRVAKMVEGWPVDWIKDMYLYVNRPEAKTPAALWWWLYKDPKK